MRDTRTRLFELWFESKPNEWPEMWPGDEQAAYACWLLGVKLYCEELNHNIIRETAQRGLGIKQPEACFCLGEK